MAIDIRPETEQLVREEMRTGRFQSVDDLIVQGVQALHERDPHGGAGECSADARRRAAGRIRELRKGIRLESNGLTLREYAHLGHRH